MQHTIYILRIFSGIMKLPLINISVSIEMFCTSFSLDFRKTFEHWTSNRLLHKQAFFFIIFEFNSQMWLAIIKDLYNFGYPFIFFFLFHGLSPIASHQIRILKSNLLIVLKNLKPRTNYSIQYFDQ